MAASAPDRFWRDWNSRGGVQVPAGGMTLIGNSSIRSGQTSYNVGTGFWLGMVNGVAKFSLGNPSGNHIKWDGSVLTVSGGISVDYATITGSKPPSNADNTQTAVNGTVTITGGGITMSGGGVVKAGKTTYASTTAGFYLGYDSTTYKFHIGDATNYLKWTGTDLTIVGHLTGGTISIGSGFVVDEIGTVIAYTLGSANATFSTSLGYDFLPAILATSSGTTEPTIKATNTGNKPSLKADSSGGSGIGVEVIGSSSQPALKVTSSGGQDAISATGAIYSSATVFGTTSTTAAINGAASGAGGKGVWGQSTHGSGYGVYASNSGGGYALYINGTSYLAGNVTVNGNVTALSFIGNVTGSAGSCTGNAATATSATSATYATTSGEVVNVGNASVNASSGSYKVTMQTDGNLVVYSGATPLWSSEDTNDRLDALESDRRLKDNIRDTTTSGLDMIKAVRVVDFKWKPNPKKDSTRFQTGLIAQEVQELLPWAVRESKISGNLNLSKAELVPYLVKAVQELSEQVKALQTEINALKSK
jgi:hypothetical protein